MFKKIKENDELKSFDVDVVTNFFKVEVECSSEAKVYTDNDNFEDNRIIQFSWNVWK